MFDLYVDLCVLFGGIYSLLYAVGFIPPKSEAVKLRIEKNLYFMYLVGIFGTITGIFMLINSIEKWTK